MTFELMKIFVDVDTHMSEIPTSSHCVVIVDNNRGGKVKMLWVIFGQFC